MSTQANDRQERRLYDESRARRARAEHIQYPYSSNEALAREDDINYAWSHTTNSTDAWGRQMPPGYMPRPSREWAAQASVAMAQPPFQSTQGYQSFRQQFWDCGTPDAHANPAPFAHEHAYARGRSFYPADDYYARDLQRRFDLEDRVGRKDATAARELQGRYDREESKRQEREAYQRRKAEERQGEETVKANAKQCPKCRWFIQKNNGCDHVSPNPIAGWLVDKCSLLRFIDDMLEVQA